MEILKFSKDELRAVFSADDRLADMILKIERRLEEKNQVVCGIRVNELALTDKDEVKFAETRCADIESLEISYRSTESLLEDSVRSLVEWVEELKKSVINTSEEFRGPEVAGPAYQFSRVIANIEWFIEALQVIKGHIAPGAEWQACESRLVAALKELEGAYRAPDYILVADVLEYEVSSALDQWREILSNTTAA